MKKPLVFGRALNKGPIVLGIESQGFLDQVPTAGESGWHLPRSLRTRPTQSIWEFEKSGALIHNTRTPK